MARYLVVAHQTAESEGLIDELHDVAHRDAAAEFVLLVPATPVVHLATWEEGETLEVATRRAASAAQALRDRGIAVSASRVGDASPVLAVEDELRLHGPYTAIVISTLAPGVSRWLGRDAVARLRDRVGIPVTHVLPRPAPAGR